MTKLFLPVLPLIWLIVSALRSFLGLILSTTEVVIAAFVV